MRARVDPGFTLREARSDPTAFAALVASEGGWLCDFFVERGADRDDAELLAAETLATAYLDRARFRGVTEDEGREWLSALAYRRLARFNHLEVTEHRALERLGVNTYAACPAARPGDRARRRAGPAPPLSARRPGVT